MGIATATATPQAAIGSVSEMPRTRIAQEKLVTTRRELNDVSATLARYQRALSPVLATEETPEDLWHARAHIDETMRRHAQLSLDVLAAERAAEEARDTDRAELRATFRTLKHQALQLVIPALRAAEAQMLELQRLENREHELLGAVDRVAWTSLGKNDAGEGALDNWIAYVRAAGLVD